MRGEVGWLFVQGTLQDSINKRAKILTNMMHVLSTGANHGKQTAERPFLGTPGGPLTNRRTDYFCHRTAILMDI